MLLLLVRLAMTRSFEREFAYGLGTLALVTMVAAKLSVTNLWVDWAEAILKL